MPTNCCPAASKSAAWKQAPRMPSGKRSSGLGVVVVPELSSMLGLSKPPGHSSGYTAAASSANAS
eukprot:2805408-Rhodomonas_salina.1